MSTQFAECKTWKNNDGYFIKYTEIRDGKFQEWLKPVIKHTYWARLGIKVIEFYQKENSHLRILEGERQEWLDGILVGSKFYVDGKLNGDYMEWHANGKLKTKTFFRCGQTEGKTQNWYDDGKPRMEWTSRDGKLDGEVKQWDENGIVMLYEYYVTGKLADPKFSWEKKYAMINAKKRLYFQRTSSSIDPHMIPDLSKIVCEYVSG
jgi:hypothetical protein